MKITTTKLRAIFIALIVFGLAMPIFSAPPAYAHPEDEFCTPGEDGLDPALCRALAELDSADRVADVTEIDGKTVEIVIDRPVGETITLYVKIGFQHIIPMGLDHILFVIALCLASTQWRPLVLQISAFTLAHTATLGLTAAGVITPSSGWVEPLIAATIAWAAIENLIFKEMQWWRPLLVFGFGLIHGMGFAGAFGELGLPEGQFWPALIGFNVGVEIGQLAVVGMVLAASLLIKGLLKQAGQVDHYRHVWVWPISAAIAVLSTVWVLQRTGLM